MAQALNTSVVHRLCQNDTDFVKIDAVAGKELVIFLANYGGGAAARVRLTDGDNTISIPRFLAH